MLNKSMRYIRLFFSIETTFEESLLISRGESATRRALANNDLKR